MKNLLTYLFVLIIVAGCGETNIESMKNNEQSLDGIHEMCGWHEKEILSSDKVGCFYCLELYSPNEIKEWIEEGEETMRGKGKTALCPKCGIDAVLPTSTQYQLNSDLLKMMNKAYF